MPTKREIAKWQPLEQLLLEFVLSSPPHTQGVMMMPFRMKASQTLPEGFPSLFKPVVVGEYVEGRLNVAKALQWLYDRGLSQHTQASLLQDRKRIAFIERMKMDDVDKMIDNIDAIWQNAAIDDELEE